MADVGRPTEMDKEALTKIKEAVLDGKNLKEIANIIGISEQTIYSWHSTNYKSIADKIEGWKRDRKLMLAEKNIESILQLDVTDKDFVKTVSDMSKFVTETLGKENYSKRTELTGADGANLIPSQEAKDRADKAINEYLEKA